MSALNLFFHLELIVCKIVLCCLFQIFPHFRCENFGLEAGLAQFGAVVYLGGAQWMVALGFVQLWKGQRTWFIKLIPCLGGIFLPWCVKVG